MRKMKPHLKQKNTFLKRGNRKLIDPRARIIVAFQLIKECFEERGFSLESDSAEPEFRAVKYAVLMVLLESSFALSRMKLWDDLQIAGCNASKGEAGTRAALMEKIDSARRRIREGSSQKVIVWAMNALNTAVKDMAARFVVGAVADVETFLEKGYEHDRYKCAALLPILADLMAKVWLPLRVQIFHAQKRLL
jgi:hypothetical protein